MRRIAISRETEIVRLHHAEGWNVGTIASQLHLHQSVVRRVLGQAGVPQPKLFSRPSIADPYMPFVMATLETWPEICASRLFQMVCKRGYPGKESRFRDIVATVRPRPTPEAFLRLSTLPAEQGQVDWGSFCSMEIDGAVRKLLAFVMVLSWSRKIFLRFFLDVRMPAFLTGHVEGFRAFAGVPRVLLYDNLNTHYDGPDKRWTNFNLRHGKRFRFVYTPIHASWMNQVEIWFSILQRRILRHGSFTSPKQQKTRLRGFIALWNRVEAHPFRWTWRATGRHNDVRDVA